MSHDHYGMTETSPLSTMTRRDDDLTFAVEVRTVMAPVRGSVGEPESGLTGATGTTWLAVHRGYSVMLGYWYAPSRRPTRSMPPGEYTGDLATMATRLLRHRRVASRHGHPRRRDIYPREIEDFRLPPLHRLRAGLSALPDSNYCESYGGGSLARRRRRSHHRRPCARTWQWQARPLMCRATCPHRRVPDDVTRHRPRIRKIEIALSARGAVQL